MNIYDPRCGFCLLLLIAPVCTLNLQRFKHFERVDGYRCQCLFTVMWKVEIIWVPLSTFPFSTISVLVSGMMMKLVNTWFSSCCRAHMEQIPSILPNYVNCLWSTFKDALQLWTWHVCVDGLFIHCSMCFHAAMWLVWKWFNFRQIWMLFERWRSPCCHWFLQVLIPVITL